MKTLILSILAGVAIVTSAHAQSFNRGIMHANLEWKRCEVAVEQDLQAVKDAGGSCDPMLINKLHQDEKALDVALKAWDQANGG
jgi:hypothetical protein